MVIRCLKELGPKVLSGYLIALMHRKSNAVQ